MMNDQYRWYHLLLFIASPIPRPVGVLNFKASDWPAKSTLVSYWFKNSFRPQAQPPTQLLAPQNAKVSEVSVVAGHQSRSLQSELRTIYGLR